jgi:L-ascorbate metabolism protein UlaG (beta-lactamase superfamily)
MFFGRIFEIEYDVTHGATVTRRPRRLSTAPSKNHVTIWPVSFDKTNVDASARAFPCHAPVYARGEKPAIGDMVHPEHLEFARDAFIADQDARVRVRWLGTAGFEIRCDNHVVLLDPYITRASLGQCVLGRISSDIVAIKEHVPRADAIIVGHTHFDHALDVAAIARQTGAKVFGSRSAIRLCRAAKIPDSQLHMVERDPGQEAIEAEVGPFALRFAPSAHSRFMLGRVPFPGEISDCDDVPVKTGDYRCGAVFRVEMKVAGRTIVHLGSAELTPGGRIPRDVDMLLLCVAGWRSSPDLPERVMRHLSPQRVLLSHWDNFFLPIRQPARMLPAMSMPQLVDRLSSLSRDVRIGTLPIRGEVGL